MPNGMSERSALIEHSGVGGSACEGTLYPITALLVVARKRMIFIFFWQWLTFSQLVDDVSQQSKVIAPFLYPLQILPKFAGRPDLIHRGASPSSSDQR